MLSFNFILNISKSKHLTEEEILSIPDGTVMNLIAPLSKGYIPGAPKGLIHRVRVFSKEPIGTYFFKQDFPCFLTNQTKTKYFLSTIPCNVYFFERKDLNQEFALIPLVN